MARARSPNRDRAFELYKESNGEKPLVEIADELAISDSLVRKWKSQDNWDDQLNGNDTIRIPKKKGNVTKRKVTPNTKKVIEQLENSNLTDKQRLFCLYYVKSFNATMAAIKAGYSKDTAYQIGHENLRKPEISAEIKRLKGRMQEDVYVSAIDVLNEYIKIAFSDITDFVSFGKREIQVDVDEDGNPVTSEVNYVDFNDSKVIDGTLISEVKQGRDGISIKLVDKMKALEKLEQYFDLFPDKFKRRIEEEKLELAKMKLNAEEDEKPIEVIITRKGER